MNHTLKVNLVILGASIVLGLGIIRWHTVSNVPFCVQSPGCTADNQPKGTLTDRSNGFPAVYRETSTFKPQHSDQSQPNYAGYSSAQAEKEGFSLPYILVNIIFWFALLRLLANYLPKRRQAGAGDSGTQPAKKDDLTV